MSLARGSRGPTLPAPVTIDDRTLAFVQTERDRFSDKRNNVFAFSWSHVREHVQYLRIILADYAAVQKDFFDNLERKKRWIDAQPSGGGLVGDEGMKLLSEGTTVMCVLHLRIKTFYLVAKILLDRTAQAVEFYFGQGRLLRSIATTSWPTTSWSSRRRRDCRPLRFSCSGRRAS